MPEDQAAAAAAVEEVVKPDPMAERLHNQSQEFNRKIGNVEDKITALLNKLNPPAPKEEEADLDSLLYSDPKAFAKAVKEQARQEARGEYSKARDTDQKTNAVLGQLASDFPELQDRGSELSKAAQAEYINLPDHVKADPLGYEIAVNRAALKQGTKPVSQRSNDEFTLSSSSGTKPRAPKKDSEMDAVLAVAELFGKDISDPAYIKTLKGHTKRNYYKYQEPKSVKE